MDVRTRYDFPQLIDELGLVLGAEVGVNQGDFSFHLLRWSRMSILYSVDNWVGRAARRKREAEKILKRFGERSKILHLDSVEASRQFADSQLDFIYIDADHRYKPVAADLKAWFPKVRAGGVMAGHDYIHAPKCQVIQAVDEFMEGRPEQLMVTDEAHPSWWFVRD